MNARELYVDNGDGTYAPAGVYYCGICQLTAANAYFAEQCCKPSTCEGCGSEAPRGWTLCQACREKLRREKTRALFDDATKVKLADYKGRMVYVEERDEYVLTSELAEWLEEKREEFEDRPERLGAWTPPLVFGTYEQRYFVDAGDVIEHALSDAFEDAADHVSAAASKELDEFLTAWSRANLPTGYMVDHKVAVLIEAE